MKIITSFFTCLLFGLDALCSYTLQHGSRKYLYQQLEPLKRVAYIKNKIMRNLDIPIYSEEIPVGTVDVSARIFPDVRIQQQPSINYDTSNFHLYSESAGLSFLMPLSSCCKGLCRTNVLAFVQYYYV